MDTHGIEMAFEKQPLRGGRHLTGNQKIVRAGIFYRTPASLQAPLLGKIFQVGRELRFSANRSAKIGINRFDCHHLTEKFFTGLR